MRAPWAGVPLPGGRLVPSGRTAMSHCLMSASEIGLPSFGLGLCARAVPTVSATAQASSGLRIDMLDLPFAVDAPAGEAVVVLVGESERRRQRLPRLAARGDELGAQRLHVAGLVPGAA